MVSFLPLRLSFVHKRQQTQQPVYNSLQILLNGTRNSIEQDARRIDDLDGSDSRYILGNDVFRFGAGMEQSFPGAT
jgi:hypothetical protein